MRLSWSALRFEARWTVAVREMAKLGRSSVLLGGSYTHEGLEWSNQHWAQATAHHYK